MTAAPSSEESSSTEQQSREDPADGVFLLLLFPFALLLSISSASFLPPLHTESNTRRQTQTHTALRGRKEREIFASLSFAAAAASSCLLRSLTRAHPLCPFAARMQGMRGTSLKKKKRRGREKQQALTVSESRGSSKKQEAGKEGKRERKRKEQSEGGKKKRKRGDRKGKNNQNDGSFCDSFTLLRSLGPFLRRSSSSVLSHLFLSLSLSLSLPLLAFPLVFCSSLSSRLLSSNACTAPAAAGAASNPLSLKHRLVFSSGSPFLCLIDSRYVIHTHRLHRRTRTPTRTHGSRESSE